MRHGMTQRRMGRNMGHRKALFRNQLASLIESERIVTTLVKAKELRPIAEKVITLGKKGTLHHRRQAARVVPSDTLIKKLFDDIAPRFADRNGGYTRIVKLGARRGDGTEMAILEFVDFKFEAATKSSTPAPKKSTEKKSKEAEPAAEAEEKKPAKKPAAKKAAPKKEKKADADEKPKAAKAKKPAKKKDK